jgi:hypothetical protein
MVEKGEGEDEGALASDEGVDSTSGGVGAGSGAMQQNNVPSEVKFSQEVFNDGKVMVNATVVLAAKSWFAIAVSQTGAMVGSQALVGIPDATSNGTSTSGQEFGLHGKFTEAIKPITEAEQFKFVTLESSFAITEDNFGNYIHSLSATFSGDVCGKQLIWAHANPDGPSPTDVLGYHGPHRGVLGTIAECQSQPNPAAAAGDSDAPLEGRGQDDDVDDTSASSFRMPRAPLDASLAVSVVVITLNKVL